MIDGCRRRRRSGLSDSGLFVAITFGMCMLLRIPSVTTSLFKTGTTHTHTQITHNIVVCRSTLSKSLHHIRSTFCIPRICAPASPLSVQTTKKRRIVARVQCRNIKNDCPKVTCEDPVRVAGRCCKVCPGEQFSEYYEQIPIRII